MKKWNEHAYATMLRDVKPSFAPRWRCPLFFSSLIQLSPWENSCCAITFLLNNAPQVPRFPHVRVWVITYHISQTLIPNLIPQSKSKHFFLYKISATWCNVTILWSISFPKHDNIFLWPFGHPLLDRPLLIQRCCFYSFLEWISKCGTW